jgi:hypothetical protein
MLAEAIDKLNDGVCDGWYLDNPYVVLRYIGYEGEDQDPLIMETDWYSMAWVALMQVLPDACILTIMRESDWFMKAAHQKYFELVGEAEELCDYNFTVEVFDGDIILVKKGEVDAPTDDN